MGGKGRWKMEYELREDKNGIRSEKIKKGNETKRKGIGKGKRKWDRNRKGKGKRKWDRNRKGKGKRKWE